MGNKLFSYLIVIVFVLLGFSISDRLNKTLTETPTCETVQLQTLRPIIKEYLDGYGYNTAPVKIKDSIEIFYENRVRECNAMIVLSDNTEMMIHFKMEPKKNNIITSFIRKLKAEDNFTVEGILYIE